MTIALKTYRADLVTVESGELTAEGKRMIKFKELPMRFELTARSRPSVNAGDTVALDAHWENIMLDQVLDGNPTLTWTEGSPIQVFHIVK